MLSPVTEQDPPAGAPEGSRPAAAAPEGARAEAPSGGPEDEGPRSGGPEDEGPTTASPRRSLRRSGAGRTTVVVGVAIGVLGLGFVVRTLVDQASEVRSAVAGGDPWLLVAALATAALAMVAVALPWRGAIELLGGRLDAAGTVARYFAGEIGKYVPGTVWAVVGRGELARRSGVRAEAAYGSVALSLLALYLAALAAATATLPAVLAQGGDRRPWLLLLLLPVGLVALHHAVTSRVVAVAGRLRRKPLDVAVPRWGEILVLVARYLPAWVLIGSATWLVAEALGGDASWPQVVFATSLSWFAGFVVVPVPGGVGVREAVFLASVPGLDAGVAAAAALVARIAFVVVDAVGAVVASSWLARHGRTR